LVAAMFQPIQQVFATVANEIGGAAEAIQNAIYFKTSTSPSSRAVTAVTPSTPLPVTIAGSSGGLLGSVTSAEDRSTVSIYRSNITSNDTISNAALTNLTSLDMRNYSKYDGNIYMNTTTDSASVRVCYKDDATGNFNCGSPFTVTGVSSVGFPFTVQTKRNQYMKIAVTDLSSGAIVVNLTGSGTNRP
jgi:hypothetical protein